MWHINTKIHSTTKSAPFALMFGRSPLPGPLEEDAEHQSQEDAQQEWVDFWSTFKSDILPRIQEFHRNQAEKRRKKQKRTTVYKNGDIVMHRLLTPEGKRLSRAVGPFRVLGRLETGDYTLEDRNGETFAAATHFLHRAHLADGEKLALRLTDFTADEDPYAAPIRQKVVAEPTGPIEEEPTEKADHGISLRPRTKPRLTQILDL